MNIGAVTSKIESGASTVLGGLSKTKPMRKFAEAFQKDPENMIAMSTVASIVIKDGVGCYKYVTQSLNNDRIPEEKRKFVAALDLTNGVLMIAAQIAMFFAMKRFSEPIFNKIFKNTFNDKNIKNGIERIRMIQGKLGVPVSRKLNLEKDYKTVRKNALDVFKFVADIAAATIVGKRIIVPLIATPLANKTQKLMDKKSGGKHADAAATTPTEASTDKQAQDTKKLDVQEGETNLLKRYKLYYGPIKTNV